MLTSAAAVPVAIQGTSTNTYILGAILVGILTLIGTIVKTFPTMKKIKSGSDDSLRHDLMALLATERAAWLERENALHAEIIQLKSDNAQLHGQIHELRNQMLELMLAAGRTGTPRAQKAARGRLQDRGEPA